MLRARTGSALARAFKRFARCAVAGLALAGLAACGGGGGGSSTPAETTPTTPTPEPTPTPAPAPSNPPEIPITPAPMSDILAEAVSITGMEAVEGQLDSAEDADYFKIQIDEPGTVTFWMTETDVEIELLDSAGNVLDTAQTIGGGSSSGLAPAAVNPLLILRIAAAVGTYFIRIKIKAAVKSKAAIKYVLNHRITRALLRKVRNHVKKNLMVGRPEDIKCNDYYTTEGTPLSCSASLNGLTFGPFKIGFEATVSGIRLLPGSTSECRSRAAPGEASIRFEASTTAPVADDLKSALASAGAQIVEELTAWSIDIVKYPIHDNGPRLVPGGPPLSLAVAEGGSATMTLTDHIEDPEDPDGGPLMFKVVKTPAGLSVTRNGPILTIAAREGAADGSITVAATDRSNVCRTFLAEVSVKEEESLVALPAPDTVYLGRGETRYTSRPLGEYFVYDGTSKLTFSWGITPPSTDEFHRALGSRGEWSIRRTGDKLEIVSGSRKAGDFAEVSVIATSSSGLSGTAIIEVEIRRIVCCNSTIFCNCLEGGRSSPRCSDDTEEVTSCPLTGLSSTGDPVQRTCCGYGVDLREYDLGMEFVTLSCSCYNPRVADTCRRADTQLASCSIDSIDSID